jgi:hypothetical protein
MQEKDYNDILNRYNLPISKTKRNNRINVERTLTNKFCKCLKKIGTENEARSIGICTKTIYNRLGLKRGLIKCKDKDRKVLFTKRKGLKTSRRKTKKNRRKTKKKQKKN